MTDWTFKVTIEYLGHKYSVETEQGHNTDDAVAAMQSCVNAWWGSDKWRLEEKIDE